MANISIPDSIDAYYKGMQEIAKAKVSGTYTRGKVPESMFKPSIDRWLAERTTPDLIPHIDGQPVDISTYENFIRNNINNLEEIYKRVALKQVSAGAGIKWETISATHTAVTGKYSITPYDKIIKKFENSTRVVQTVNPPTKPLHGYAINELKSYFTANNIQVATNKAFDFLVIYIPKLASQSNIAVTGKAQVLIKDGDSFKGIPGTGELYPSDNFYPHGKDKVLFNFEEVIQTGNVLSQIYLDIEHLKSVAAESIEGIITGLTAVKQKALDANNKASITEAQKKINNQIIKDLDAQIANAKLQLNTALKVGRVVSDLLPENVSVKQLQELLNKLPEKNGQIGLNLLFYNTVTQSPDLRTLTLTHSISYEFIPGLGSFNRGVASAIERIAKGAVVDAALNPASPSPFTRLMFGALASIFNDPRFLRKIKEKSKRSSQEKFFFPLFKKNKLKKPEKPKIGISNSNNFRPPRLAARSPVTQQTESIVPLINAELKRYVIEEMSYPSLENRSGRFASSVRVLSAQEDAAVQYTYQKSPYQIFSPSRGKRPWATEERDPAKIIDRAIKKLGQDRFQKVFRTEEV